MLMMTFTRLLGMIAMVLGGPNHLGRLIGLGAGRAHPAHGPNRRAQHEEEGAKARTSHQAPTVRA